MNWLRIYCLLVLVARVLSGCATFQWDSSSENTTDQELDLLTPQLLQGSYDSGIFDILNE